MPFERNGRKREKTMEGYRRVQAFLKDDEQRQGLIAKLQGLEMFGISLLRLENEEQQKLYIDALISSIYILTLKLAGSAENFVQKLLQIENDEKLGNLKIMLIVCARIAAFANDNTTPEQRNEDLFIISTAEDQITTNQVRAIASRLVTIATQN